MVKMMNGKDVPGALELLEPGDIASLMGLKAPTIRMYISRGLLPVFAVTKGRKCKLIHPDDFEAFRTEWAKKKKLREEAAKWNQK